MLYLHVLIISYTIYSIMYISMLYIHVYVSMLTEWAVVHSFCAPCFPSHGLIKISLILCYCRGFFHHPEGLRSTALQYKQMMIFFFMAVSPQRVQVGIPEGSTPSFLEATNTSDPMPSLSHLTMPVSLHQFTFPWCLLSPTISVSGLESILDKEVAGVHFQYTYLM